MKLCLLSLIVLAAGCSSPSSVIRHQIDSIQQDERAITTMRLVPGGEFVYFSQEMCDFISCVTNNPATVREYLQDKPMTKEIAISLGLVKQKWAIDTLIASIPTSGVSWVEGRDNSSLDLGFGTNRPLALIEHPFPCPTTLVDETSWIYFSAIHSLTHLTGVSFGRCREGTYFSSDVKGQWEAWWNSNKETFVFEDVVLNTACGSYQKF